MKVKISAPTQSHLPYVLKALLGYGWRIRRAPEKGLLARNGQLILFRSSKFESRIRLFVYKVTESSRGKPYERRIEITSTYPKGLRKRRDFQDVVLGYENTRAIFVGVDPRRIAHGGPTGNASSFFDKEGLTWSHSDEILVKPRRVTLFPTGVEFHAFFKPGRLAEYFFNVDAIHRGSYAGRGLYSGIVPKSEISSALLTLPAQHTGGEILEIEGPQPSARKATVSNSILEAYEFGKSKPIRRAKLSPERLL